MEEKKKKTKKTKAKRVVLTILMIVCILIMAVSAYICIRKITGDMKSEDDYKDLRDEITEVTPEEEAPLDIDWDELKKTNPDIVAWIYIGCNDTSYPVLYKDNEYYLHRAVDGSWTDAGCIFMEEDNNPDLSDPNTIIYGHNMLNGSMFGTLYKIYGESLWQNDPYFWMLTPHGNYKYKMFSMFSTYPETEVYTIFFTRDRQFLEWCSKMHMMSGANVGEKEFSSEDCVVTLSTCGSTSATRTVVLGYLDKVLPPKKNTAHQTSTPDDIITETHTEPATRP